MYCSFPVGLVLMAARCPYQHLSHGFSCCEERGTHVPVLVAGHHRLLPSLQLMGSIYDHVTMAKGDPKDILRNSLQK